ncbi:MAG: PilZ domain-containing protein [Candidatus Omnitrophica bacterium]|nr:PilZ domain-containing protein [Candidatus Omnitrophota bacterium]
MESLDDHKDRRTFLRIGTNIPLTFLKQRSDKPFSAQISDISANGIGLTSNQKMSCQTPLKLIVNIPNDGPFCAEGEVAWIKKIRFHKYRIGITLTKINLLGIARVLNFAKTIPEPLPEEIYDYRPSLLRWFKKPGLAIP